MAKFPCLRLAYEAVEAGGAKTVALNAADEVAVSAFLNGKIGFSAIHRVIADVLRETKAHRMGSIAEVLEADAEARRLARGRIELLAQGVAVAPVSAGVATRKD